MYAILDFPVGTAAKKLPANEGDTKFDPWVRKISWKRKWKPTPTFLPGKSHEQRSLAGYSPWSCKESDLTELLRIHIYTMPFYKRDLRISVSVRVLKAEYTKRWLTSL